MYIDKHIYRNIIYKTTMCKILTLIQNRTRLLQLKLQEREILQRLRLLKKKNIERKKWQRQFVQKKLIVVIL